MANDLPGRDSEEPVPRLPRGRGLKLSGPQWFRIIGLAAILVFLIVAQRPCANAVSTFVTSFDERSEAIGGGDATGSAGGAAGKAPRGVDDGSNAGSAAGSAGSGSGGQQYEHLRPDMTDAEMKAAIERARAKAHGNGSAH